MLFPSISDAVVPLEEEDPVAVGGDLAPGDPVGAGVEVEALADVFPHQAALEDQLRVAGAAPLQVPPDDRVGHQRVGEVGMQRVGGILDQHVRQAVPGREVEQDRVPVSRGPPARAVPGRREDHRRGRRPLGQQASVDPQARIADAVGIPVLGQEEERGPGPQAERGTLGDDRLARQDDLPGEAPVPLELRVPEHAGGIHGGRGVGATGPGGRHGQSGRKKPGASLPAWRAILALPGDQQAGQVAIADLQAVASRPAREGDVLTALEGPPDPPRATR